MTRIIKAIFLILVFFITYSTDSYTQTINLDSIYEPYTVPIGVYYSFEELKNKQPKDPTYFRIEKRSRKDIALNGGGLYGIDQTSISKQERKKIGKQCIGISNGDIFVISDSYTLGGWRGYSKCYLSGPLVFIPLETNLARYTGGGIIPSLIKTGSGFVFDINMGKYYKLKKELLNSMIEKHHIKGFEGKKIMDNAANILMEVNKRRKYRR